MVMSLVMLRGERRQEVEVTMSVEEGSRGL